MDSLAIRVSPRAVEPADAPPPTGLVAIERDGQLAHLLTPPKLDPARAYPVLVVLHGAGRQDEALARAYRAEAEQREALVLVPRSHDYTWDLITGANRTDLDFLEYALDLLWRRYSCDFERHALLGYSDGASYALSVGLSNPHLFRAVMAWAAGFVRLDTSFVREGVPLPDVLVEYGTHDPIFPFEHIALPMREALESRGYPVLFRVDEGGRHWPSGDFQPEALDWFFSLPLRPAP